MQESAKDITTGEMVQLIVEAAQDLKATHITELNLEGIESAPTSAFVVCTGRSTSQVSSIADNIREELSEKAKCKPYSSDGYRNSQWIVLDYGNVMVHIFLPDTREYYNIEDLWSDAVIKEIPDLD
jgi:ribosome-associated protein